MPGQIEIKICGLTSAADARLALDAGADYLGFVFYEKSPRAVTVDRLRALLAELDGPYRAIGVFVNAPRAEAAAAAEACGLHAVQIHGDEDGADFAHLPVPVWRAVKLTDRGAVPAPDEWAYAERFVVDAAAPGLYGGSGTLADWDKAAQFAQAHRAMLAGGLTPENAAEAVRRVPCLGLDVSSGVEAAPGRKDPDKVRAFIARAREAAGGTEL